MLGLHSFLKQKRPGPKLRELVGARDCRIAASLRVEWTCWWLEWVAWRWLRGMPPRGSCHVSLWGGTANTSIQHTHFSRCRGGAGPWRAWPALLINSLKEPVHWLKKELMPAPCALPLPPSLRRRVVPQRTRRLELDTSMVAGEGASLCLEGLVVHLIVPDPHRVREVAQLVRCPSRQVRDDLLWDALNGEHAQ